MARSEGLVMPDIDAAFVEQVLDVPKRERKAMYIITAKRIISGEVLKYLNGLRIGGS
jgi:hypothetical protein